MTYLLDSNVWVALLRGTKPQVAARFRAAPNADLRVCSVIVADLRYGCARSAKAAANVRNRASGKRADGSAR